MVKRLLPLISAGLAACATTPLFAPARPVEVRVPIDRPVYCSVQIPARPELPVGALHTGASAAATVRAYAASVTLLKGAVRERDAALAGCASPAGGEVTAGVSKLSGAVAADQ